MDASRGALPSGVAEASGAPPAPPVLVVPPLPVPPLPVPPPVPPSMTEEMHPRPKSSPHIVPRQHAVAAPVVGQNRRLQVSPPSAVLPPAPVVPPDPVAVQAAVPATTAHWLPELQAAGVPGPVPSGRQMAIR